MKANYDRERNNEIGRKDMTNISNAQAEEKLCRVHWQVCNIFVFILTYNGYVNHFRILIVILCTLFDNFIREFLQVFLALVVNMHPNGCNAAMIGLIIARLKETETPLIMSSDEESWFGRKINYIPCCNIL